MFHSFTLGFISFCRLQGLLWVLCLLVVVYVLLLVIFDACSMCVYLDLLVNDLEFRFDCC